MVNGQSSQSTTALDHALAYARAGWPVVPLRTPGDRLPDGGIAKGKEARVSLHEATTDTATIERWWPPGSRSGIGVVPGKAGMVVLDVDVAGGKTGELELQALEAKHGPLPGTLEQRTPSGGRHLFFKLPEGVTGISNRKIDGCPSIDVRGHTGYVATEGTTTDRGGYQFLDWSPTEEGPPDVKMAPAWLVELLTAPAQSKGTTDTEPRKPMSERHAAALRDILTGADYHGSMTYLAASLVATGMGQGAVVTHLKALVEQSTPTEPARVSRRTSLLGSRELSRIVEWAVNNPKFKLEDQSERSEPWDEVDIADLDWVEPPPPEQVWGALVPAGVVTLFGAHGGKGKSLIGLMLCVCVALGREMFGIPTRQGVAVFYSGEDDKRVVRHRLKWLCRQMGVRASALQGRLFILDASEADPTLYREGQGRGPGMLTSTYDKLAAFLAAKGAGLVLVDNASDAYDASEIDRAKVRAFIRALAKIARASNAGMVLLAHVDKGTSRGERDGTEGYSGSTAWNNSARSRLFMREDCDGLVIEHQKANYSQRLDSLRLVWRHDRLPVLRDDSREPIVQDLLDRANTKVLLRLIHEFTTRGEFISPATQSPTNAARMLRGEPSLPKLSKSEVFKLLRSAERDGCLEKVTYRTRDRKDRERWGLTPVGMDFADIAPSAPGTPTPQDGAPRAAPDSGAPSAPSPALGYGGERARSSVIELGAESCPAVEQLQT